MPDPRRLPRPLIPWRDCYATNVVIVDRDHKQLVERINTLHEARTAGRADAVLQGLLADLMDYTREHFEREEGLMAEHGYPERDSHHAAHQKLTETVTQLQQRLQSGETQLGTEVFRVLREWLLDHIVAEDHRFGGYLNARGIY